MRLGNQIEINQWGFCFEWNYKKHFFLGFLFLFRENKFSLFNRRAWDERNEKKRRENREESRLLIYTTTFMCALKMSWFFFHSCRIKRSIVQEAVTLSYKEHGMANGPRLERSVTEPMLVNVSLVQYLDTGRWFLSIYNDELQPYKVTLVVTEAEGVSTTCSNDCSGRGSCYLGKCDCIDGYQVFTRPFHLNKTTDLKNLILK